MRVQCDVCEAAEAALVCCADEAALCAACDAQVHAANKLAGKHQRIPLIRPAASERTPCDICQDKTGWFFCVEDRALLCRGCDVSIHSSNTLASAHKRFLVTGTKVALNPLAAQDFLEETRSVKQEPDSGKASGTKLSPVREVATPKKTEASIRTASSSDTGLFANEKSNSSTLSEYLTESVPGWRVDELLNIPELASGYTLGDVVSSKDKTTEELGEFDWLADLSLFAEQQYVETFHEVPQIGGVPDTQDVVLPRAAKPSPSKGKVKQIAGYAPGGDELLLVPDLGSLPAAKRRRL